MSEAKRYGGENVVIKREVWSPNFARSNNNDVGA